jgi:dolichol-phosphate mannosyltransferase
MSIALASPSVDAAPPFPKSPRVLVSVATYNELENLPLLVDEVFSIAPQVEVLVIDDNSPDGTGVWAKERAQGDKRVHSIHRAGKLGLGTATIAAMQYAIEHNYDYLLNMDADFSHHPRYVPALLAGMQNADVMIGSRYCPGGGVKDWPFKRRLMSKSVNLYARMALGLKPGDCSGAYRCFRVETLRKLDFSKIKSRGYSFQEEILWHLKKAGARFGETPIIFADRERGQSKINGWEAIMALWIIFRMGVKNWVGL